MPCFFDGLRLSWAERMNTSIHQLIKSSHRTPRTPGLWIAHSVLLPQPFITAIFPVGCNRCVSLVLLLKHSQLEGRIIIISSTYISYRVEQIHQNPMAIWPSININKHSQTRNDCPSDSQKNMSQTHPAGWAPPRPWAPAPWPWRCCLPPAPAVRSRKRRLRQARSV